MRHENPAVHSYVPRVLAELADESAGLPWWRMLEGTLVMADISGFTTMSERLARMGPEGAEKLTDIINRFFGEMLRVARKYGGDTLTFGGDAILLVFRGEGHADRALTAATRMLAETLRVPSFNIAGGRVKLGMSVGAHSDSFLAVAAGLADKRMQLLVVGDPASRTAAAEAHAGSGELVISPESAAALTRPWVLEEAGGWLRVSPGSTVADPAPLEETAPPQPHIDDRLLPFAPPAAREAAEKGVGVRDVPPEHRRVSVVFVGVDGLNDVLRTQGAGTTLTILQDYMSEVVGLADKHSGFLVSTDISTAGFKLILAFGAPVAHEFAAANAARFALEMREIATADSGPVRQRIGINGGHVFAGDVGPAWRRQYTIMGDEVNLAARLMGHAGYGAIVAAHSWAEHVTPRFCTDAPTPIRVKGKHDEVLVCTLEDETEERAPDDHDGTPFLGRESQLGLLRQAWAEAASGRGGTLFVRGEPGVGKSRLFDEALTRMGLETRSVRAFCEQHLQGIPFAPWVELLRSILGLDGKESIEERTSATSEAVARWADDLIDLGSLLNPLLHVQLPQSDVVSSLGKQARRERLVELMVRLALASCPRGGGVLLVEDIDWADDSSMEAIARLADTIRDSRFLLLLSARTSEPLPMLPDSVSTIELPELSRADSLELIRRSLRAVDLPEAVADAVHTKTRGNPLFLEEVVHSLGAPGVLERIMEASSVSQAAEMATLAIPDRVQGLLMSRLDVTPLDQRELLRVACVVGREFERRLLDGLAGLPAETMALDRLLEGLVRSAVITETVDGSAFRFRHALMQEVTYESLPYSRRREIHAEVAERLEATSILPDHGLLVHHYSRAGERDRARVHAVKAAGSSQEVYAYHEAIDYLRIALDTVTSPTPSQASVRSWLDESIGDCLESMARHGEAVESFLRARRRWRSPSVRAAAQVALAEIASLDDPEARASDLCRKIAVCVEHQHADYKRALRWIDRAGRLLPPGRRALAARLEVTRGVALFRLGLLADALAHGERGLELARDDGDKPLQAYALAMLTSPLVGLGMLHRAIDVSLEAVSLYDETRDLAGQAAGHGNLAACYQLVGDLNESLVHYEIALALHERLSYHTGVSIMHNNIAEVLLQVGQTDKAIEHLDQVVHEWEARNRPPVLVGLALVNLSKGLMRRSDMAGARLALDQGHRLLLQADARGLLLDASLQEVRLRLEEGRVEDAKDACLQTIEAARDAGAKLNEAQALCLLGHVKVACRELVEAEDHLQCSIALAEEIGADYERGAALLAVSELYVVHAPTRTDRHVEPLSEAIALFERMGAEHDLRRAFEIQEHSLTMR